MPLCQVAEYNNYGRGQYLCKYRIDTKTFYEYFKQNIIQHQVEHTYHEISKKLDPSFHFRITEDHIFRHKESNRKIDTESDE